MILKKLQIRFIVINMILVSLVLLGIFLANTISTAQKIAGNSYSYLNEEIRRLNLLPLDGTIKKDLPPSPFPHDIIWLRVKENDTKVLNPVNAPDYTDEYIEEIVAQALIQDNDKGLLREYDLRYDTIKSPPGELIIGFIDVSYELDFIYGQVINYLLIGISSLVVFFIISFFLSKIVIRPVEKAFSQQRQFVSDASHELKTPITVILANASIILNSKDNKNTNKWVGYIDKEANRMKKLVEDLLFMARLDEADHIIMKAKFCLSDAIYECVLPFEPVAFEGGITIDNDIAPDIYMKGNSDQIKRLIMILLDNAFKYSPEGSSIAVSLSSSGSKARVSVHNNGPHIPEDEVSKIFERFYRLDKARDRSNSSYGLGLSMAKQIVEAHKGEILVDTGEEKGTTFIVVLPVSN